MNEKELIEEYLDEINDINNRKRKMFLAGLIVTIIFAFFSTIALGWLIYSIIYFVDFTVKLGIDQNLYEEQYYFWLIQFVISTFLFCLLFVGVYVGAALMIVSSTVFGSQIRHRQHKILVLKDLKNEKN